MTPEEIKIAIALAIRDETTSDLGMYVIASAIASALAFLGAYFGSYAKRKGEDRATRESFDRILNQLIQSTKATETVKAEYSRTFNTTVELYRLLARANRSPKAFLHSGESTRDECLKHAASCINGLEHFFSENDIFFADNHVATLRELLDEIRDAFHVVWGASGEGVQPEWDRAVDVAIQDVLTRINPLQKKIREILRKTVCQGEYPGA
jgi:hypothetical protein